MLDLLEYFQWNKNRAGAQFAMDSLSSFLHWQLRHNEYIDTSHRWMAES